MIDIVPDHSERFARKVGPATDDVIEEMHEFARGRTPDWAERFPQVDEFPTVGPEVGGWLQMVTRLVDARRVFEFGSGFGYSAYWFARALPVDGELVLTEVDERKLEKASEFLKKGGFDDVARYELGDALETIEQYEGPFDVVLLDHENDRYREGFEAVREKVPPGGVIVADNVMEAPGIEFDQLLEASFGGEPPDRINDQTRGIYEYLAAVLGVPDFETAVLPLGGGITVSRRIDD
ncbi:MAG: O-methyltransferase [Halapricum sp.]